MREVRGKSGAAHLILQGVLAIALRPAFAEVFLKNEGCLRATLFFRIAIFCWRVFSLDERTTKMEDNGKMPPKILIVDDNIPNLELLQAYLEDIDCITEQATDGYQAMEMIEKSCPDILLLDVMMPKISGFEVCKKLKSEPATADLPIIMVTALSELGDIERAIDCGADDFLSKPINKLELLTRVKTMLRIKDLTDKLERSLQYISQIEGRRDIEGKLDF